MGLLLLHRYQARIYFVNLVRRFSASCKAIAATLEEGEGNAVAFPNCYCNRPSFQNRNGLGATSFETAGALLSNPLMVLFEKLRSMERSYCEPIELFSSETIFLAQENNFL